MDQSTPPVVSLERPGQPPCLTFRCLCRIDSRGRFHLRPERLPQRHRAPWYLAFWFLPFAMGQSSITRFVTPVALKGGQKGSQSLDPEGAEGLFDALSKDKVAIDADLPDLAPCWQQVSV